MVLLDYDGTYFSEYLLIDLYANTGLNALGASQQNSLLYYDSKTKVGAEYGVRIYHVSSSIKNPYSDEYYSFTDNNNSVSDTARILICKPLHTRTLLPYRTHFFDFLSNLNR